MKTTAEIPYKQVKPSRFQPDGARGDIASLADDIKKHSLLQPIILRPVDKGYEVVAGHRRLKALEQLGIPLRPGPDGDGIVTARVMALSDDEALEALIAENYQRVDPTPLQQADLCRQLLERHAGNVQEAAARVGLSPATVARRLRLLALPREARAALDAGRLTLSAAELLGTLQDEGEIREAWRDATRHQMKGEVLDARPVRYIVERRQRELRSAPFDREDATLPGGACAACPKRASAQALLFDEAVGKHDRCLDGACWEAKVKEAGARRIAEAKAAGATVVRGAEAKRIVDAHGIVRDGKLVDLDGRCYDDPKQRTYRRLIKAAHMPPVTIVVTDERIVELVAVSAVRSALAASGHSWKRKEGVGAGTRGRTREEALREGRKVRFDNAVQVEVRRRAVEQAAGVVPLRSPKGLDALLNAVVEQLQVGLFGGRLEHVEKLYGGKLAPRSTADRARAIVALLPAHAAGASVLERALGVDRAKVRSECGAYLKAVAAAKAAPKPKVSKARARKK